ncbi:MAG: 16S rRNA (cytosine(1402)-N(4))-methyltransferase RsmH [Verrucomicrobiota bacterium]|nr:16S rRNA (cytosine(1402)-N(4))-methyltransferase RsmH [Verrucomicrobiota bacterium]
MKEDGAPNSPADVHRRRCRYRGKNPRSFDEKYKEHDPARYGDMIEHVLASGKTPAGSHRPIMVREILDVLAPRPGELALDCTLGYGGHAEAILEKLQPGGRLIGVDADPIELPKTKARLRARGFDRDAFAAYRRNFAGAPRVLADLGLGGADIVVADLGVSSMQLDNPARGFSLKQDGPLDMRMNPQRGQSASALLQKWSARRLAASLVENADEPHAELLAHALAGRDFASTTALATAIRRTLPHVRTEEREVSVRRVFQALRIAVNDEFSALDTLLRVLPMILSPGGRVAILSFHSGEDRRVKKAFETGLGAGTYAHIAPKVVRASVGERHTNPRATAAKLRWAISA